MAQKGIRDIYQNLVDDDVPPIRLQTFHEKDLTAEILDAFLPPNSPRSLGISGGYSETGNLVALAIANEPTGVLLVQFYSLSKIKSEAKSSDSNARDLAGRQLLQDILLSRDGEVYGFDLSTLTLSLFSHHTLYISNGVDIRSAFPSLNGGHPFALIKSALGDTAETYKDNILSIFEQTIFDPDHTTQPALRAWISQYLASRADLETRFGPVPRINSKNFSDQKLHFLAKLAHDALHLEQKKPTATKHSVTTSWDSKKNKLTVKSNRYQNHVQPRSNSQHIQIQVGNINNGGYILPSQAATSKGKIARVAVEGDLDGKEITSITTVGPEDLTNAEIQRNMTTLSILQGNADLVDDNPWIKNIWLSTGDMTWPSAWSLPSTAPTAFTSNHHTLNDSQQYAVEKMLSLTDDTCITLIQGPPGTGKTSVIATFVQAAIQDGHKGLWLIAQSNVAVKNIAEKLLNFGFSDFRLLVSSDFHDEWHEHLYSRIPKQVIRSHDFGVPASRPPRSCQVMLCTLSMLSSPRLHSCGFIKQIPLNTLVIDEASQIEIGGYLSIFTKFVSTLRKLCFVGDDKQLPPYGQEESRNLQSIFEISHLRTSAILLDTQYRMPPQIGEFISDAVYNGQLLSNPSHPIKDSTRACYFIDANGREQSEGTSYINPHECDAVILIAGHLQSQRKNYRIITPYDSQRNLLELTLKQSGLDWQNKCFAVDSFQGNEDDYIILSLVRTKRLGFLDDIRRNNVMLTRCKRGMFICSKRAFLEDIAANTLAGQLMAFCGEDAWLDKPEDLEKI